MLVPGKGAASYERGTPVFFRGEPLSRRSRRAILTRFRALFRFLSAFFFPSKHTVLWVGGGTRECFGVGYLRLDQNTGVTACLVACPTRSHPQTHNFSKSTSLGTNECIVSTDHAPVSRRWLRHRLAPTLQGGDCARRLSRSWIIDASFQGYLTKKRNPLGPYCIPIPRVVGGS